MTAGETLQAWIHAKLAQGWILARIAAEFGASRESVRVWSEADPATLTVQVQHRLRAQELLGIDPASWPRMTKPGRPWRDYAGAVAGYLTVKDHVGRTRLNGRSTPVWSAVCGKCGGETLIAASEIESTQRSGRMRSCGCTHAHSARREAEFTANLVREEPAA